MVIDVQNGPQPSGDGKATKELTLQDCREVRDAVAALKVTTNPAVQASCGKLDEQEGRGVLAADLLGVPLIHGDEVPNEMHKVGLQIDDLLKNAKEREDKLRQSARTARSRKRGKLEGEALEKAIAYIDLKLAEDRKALWASPAPLVLPQGRVEVKRER